MNTRRVYEFIGYNDGEKQDNGSTLIQFPVKVTVRTSNNEADGLLGAKRMVKRKKYYLDKCWEEEVHEHDNAVQEKIHKVLDKVLKTKFD